MGLHKNSKTMFHSGSSFKDYRLLKEICIITSNPQVDGFRKLSSERKSLTKAIIDDIYIIVMALERVLRELVKKEGLRKVARMLDIDSGSLYRSMMDGSNVGLNRIEAILGYFGFELKISKRKEVTIKAKVKRNRRKEVN